MTESEPPAPEWETVAHHTHLYVLPAAGAASLVLGGLSISGIGGELPRILPLALIVAGASSLVGSLASYMCVPRAEKTESSSARTPVPTSPGESSPAPQTPVARKPARSRPELRPLSGVGRASLAELARIEDELWKRWASPQRVSLGAALVEPVPETAYSPSRAGALAPYSDRDRDIVVLSGSLGAARAAPSTPPSRAAPAPPSRESPTTGGFAGFASPLVSGRSGELFDMDSLDHPAYLESINPILPRLSARDSERGKGRREDCPANSRATPRSGICSECSRRLLDFRAWVQCRVCRKPLCRECLEDSFTTEDAGSCSDCRTSRKWSASGRQSHPRAEVPGPRWVHS